MKKDIYNQGGKIVVRKKGKQMSFYWIVSASELRGEYFLLVRDYNPVTYKYFYNRNGISLSELGKFHNWDKKKYRDLSKLVESTFPLQIKYIKSEFMCYA